MLVHKAILMNGNDMKTSARNQFNGKVTSIQQGAVNDVVELSLVDGTKILSAITHSSSQALNLSVGSQAVALVKSSSIILVDNTSDLIFSARNQLSGKVSKVKLGSVNTEVEIEIASGIYVVAIVTNESANEMALATGKSMIALFKASSVILAVQNE